MIDSFTLLRIYHLDLTHSLILTLHFIGHQLLFIILSYFHELFTNAIFLFINLIDFMRGAIN